MWSDNILMLEVCMKRLCLGISVANGGLDITCTKRRYLAMWLTVSESMRIAILNPRYPESESILNRF